LKKGHKCLSHYTFGEAITAGGQVIEFNCHPDDVVRIKEALMQVRIIDLPTSRAVNVSHGGCGQYSRYKITQHKYAAEEAVLLKF